MDGACHLLSLYTNTMLLYDDETDCNIQYSAVMLYAQTHVIYVFYTSACKYLDKYRGPYSCQHFLVSNQ